MLKLFCNKLQFCVKIRAILFLVKQKKRLKRLNKVRGERGGGNLGESNQFCLGGSERNLSFLN